MSPSTEAGAFWLKEKEPETKEKMLRKKPQRCSFQNLSVPLSETNSIYPTKETALFGKQKDQMPPMILDAYFLNKIQAKLCLLLLILPKTITHV